ncbi:hypothetical protein EniLVp02_0172 [Vibrio phage EniLVp02]
MKQAGRSHAKRSTFLLETVAGRSHAHRRKASTTGGSD